MPSTISPLNRWIAAAAGCLLLAGCERPDPPPASESIPGVIADEPASASVSKWEFEEAVDPVSRESTSSARIRVTDPAAPGLMVEVEFNCGPDQHLFGRPPYVSLTSWDYSGPSEERQPFIDFNSSAPLEFRFNGRPVNVSTELLTMMSAETGRRAPQVLVNQFKVSLPLLGRGGMDDRIRTNPFAAAALLEFLRDEPTQFVSDPEFVVRMTTSTGTLTYVTTLDTPEVRRVLEACGVVYGPDTSIDAQKMPRQFAGEYQYKDVKGDDPPIPIVLSIDSLVREDDVIRFSGTQRIESARLTLKVQGTIDALTRKFSMTEAENAGSYEGTIAEDLQTIDALWTARPSGEQAIYNVRALAPAS